MEAIRILRKERKLTQMELSKLVGISQTYLSQIESGTKFPTISTLQKIATNLNMELSISFVSKQS
jgi:transcriptional regulator with XRE-family HTH domain